MSNPSTHDVLGLLWWVAVVAVQLASSVSTDSLSCETLFFLCEEVFADTELPPLRGRGCGVHSWAIKEAARDWVWGSGQALCSSARGQRQTFSWSPRLTLFSPWLGGGWSDSGEAQVGEVAEGVSRSWVLFLWIWLSDFFDARLNSMPTRLLLSWSSGGSSLPWGVPTGEQEDPIKEEKAVVTCWRTSSCLKRSEGDRREEILQGKNTPSCADIILDLIFLKPFLPTPSALP